MASPLALPDPDAGNIWYRTADSTDLAIVFVHGRNSGPRECWEAPTKPCAIYWPWLAATEPALALWSVFLARYNATDGGKRGITACAEELYTHLRSESPSPLDSRALVLVCHSLGGAVVRDLLVNHYEEFRDKHIHLMLLASPSLGAGFPKRLARFVIAVQSLVKNRRLSAELAVNTSVLEQLDKQFWRLLKPGDKRHLPFLTGTEFSEHDSLRSLPFLGRVVKTWSAQRYFDSPEELAGEDHESICKPRTRRARIHRTLIEHATRQQAALHLPAPTPHSPTTLQNLTAALQRDFSFRYEPGRLGDVVQTVYWPVRLRSPSPIHAQQAFAAAGLSRLGCSIQLWIDDLGNTKYSLDPFAEALTDWYGQCAGDKKRLQVRHFSRELGQDDRMREAWQVTRRWLGEATHSFDTVLRLAKLSPIDSMQALLARRPRRLLTPPIVWLGLRFAQDDGARVLTLSGWDEKELWETWRSLGVDPAIRAGHLYAARLAVIDNATGDRTALHMKRNDLAWRSRDDIDKALRADPPPPGLPDRETLAAWAALQCVFLPQFLSGTQVQIECDGTPYYSLEELWNVAWERRMDAIASAVAESLVNYGAEETLSA